MKLFVLMYHVPHEFGECVGVYSSLELARKAKAESIVRTISNHVREDGSTYKYIVEHSYDVDNLEIEEYELDK